MLRRYRVKVRLTPNQVAEVVIHAASPAKAVAEALQLYGPGSSPRYLPQRSKRKAKGIGPQSPEVEALMRSLMNRFKA